MTCKATVRSIRQCASKLMASNSHCNINDTRGWGGLVCWTLCWTPLSRTCTLAGFLTTGGMAWGLGDCWKTVTVGYDTYPSAWSQKINTLSTHPTPLQWNISFSCMTNNVPFKGHGEIRENFCIFVQRTSSWKVLPVGRPQRLHGAPAASVATLSMQWSRHTDHLSRTRAVSNQSRSWDCPSARMLATLMSAASLVAVLCSLGVSHQLSYSTS